MGCFKKQNKKEIKGKKGKKIRKEGCTFYFIAHVSKKKKSRKGDYIGCFFLLIPLDKLCSW